MLAHELKRCLSFLLALAMIFSAMPVQALAVEGEVLGGETTVIAEGQGETDPTETSAPAEPAPASEEHTHEYVPTVIAATCTEAGYTTYVCQCGDSYTADEIQALGHNYKTVVIEPTYEAQGYTVYTCETCGDSYEADYVPQLVQETEPVVTEPVVTEPPATEPVATEPPATEPPATEPVVSEVVQQIQSQIDGILVKYLGTTSATLEEIQVKVAQMDEITRMDVQFELQILEEDLSYMELSEDEQKMLVENNAVVSNLSDVLMDYPVDYALYASKTNTVLDGKITITDSSGNGSLSNGVVTIRAKGSLFSKATNTVTITNATDSQAQVSFDYSASSANSFQINGSGASASGSYSAVLDPKNSVTLTLQSKSGFSGTTATLKLSNFSYTAAKAESNVTFEFNSTYGSVTLGGETVNSGDVKSVTMADGAALVATAANGGRFLGWVAEDGKILSTSLSYKLIPSADMTVKAVFVGAGSAPHFAVGAAAQKSQSSGLMGLGKLYYYQVGQSYIIEGLNAAAAVAAADATNKTLVLLNDATLPAGEHTIPAGVTVLIPFDSSNTMYTTEAVGKTVDKEENYSAPTSYRTLTMADGASLIINGALSLSGKHAYAQGSKTWGGAPVDKVGYLKMEGNSAITVNNGGALYAYGFITGSGSVTANSGATIYELFQIADFRGGTQSTDMENGVFPLSQYYIQNIEVPLTIYSGAKEYAYTTIYMSNTDFGSAVAFIADNNAMFNLTSGFVTKTYDGTKDRLVVESNGALTVSSINMTVGTSSINSKNYELPINSNMTVNVKNGSSISINQDVAMLPGAEIHIENGATCTIGSGNNMYVYDADEWGNYAGATNQKLIPVQYAPGKKYTRTAADLVDAAVVVDGTVDASKGYVYTTAGGANVFGTGIVKAQPGTQTVTYQLIQNNGYVEIPLTSAKLKNADGTYMGTGYTSGIYTYDGSAWVKECTHAFEDIIVTDATCTTEGLKTVRCKDIINCSDNTRQEIIPAKGHNYQTAVTAPTCTKGGYTTYTCDCGDVYVDNEVEAAGHTEETLEAQAPTCTKTGLTAGIKCSVCNETLKVQEEVPATGHNEVSDAEAKAPTCTATGLTASTKCSVCGETLKAQQEVPATGHTEVTDEAKAPTCTATGLEEGSHCVVCGEILVAQKIVNALGHTEVIDEAKAPTCTATGLTAGTHCSVCGEVLTAQVEVPAVGHNHEGVVTAPTCTEVGYTTYTCICGDSYVADEMPAKGHSLGENADCMHAQKCTVCGAELEAALGHDYTDVVIPPTCTENGKTTHTCSRCGDSYFDSTVPALGHTEVADASKDATCTATGLTAGSHCDVCGEILVAQEVVDALGHTEVADASKDATCTETGLTAGSHCDVCGETLVAQEIVNALGHTEVADASKDATCTETGLTAGSHCDVCGETLVAQEVVDALGHTEVTDEAKAPTCTETGLKEGSHCNVCGETLVAQEVVDALGHDEVTDEAKAPTCTETGLKEGSHCNVCGETVVAQEVVDALGHDEVTDEAKAPTCTETGLTEGSHCSVCNEILTVQNEVPAIGHDLMEEEAEPAFPATCTEAGREAAHFCNNCQQNVWEEIPALGHDMQPVDAKYPTYNTVGWNAHQACGRDTCSYKEGYTEIPILDEPSIETYEDFLLNLTLLEELANEYVLQNPGKDPAVLVIKYIRTGVDRYNSGSWGIMAGSEDEGFKKFVVAMEDAVNSQAPTPEERIHVTGLKNIENFTLPNGDLVDFGHMFGTMDITIHNNFGVNHADVAGWSGDLVDLMEFADNRGISGTLEEMTAAASALLGKTPEENGVSAFNELDILGDLDGYYIMKVLETTNYEVGSLTAIFQEYFTETLDLETRAAYLMNNRFGGVSTRNALREAVYNAYCGNKVIATLEATREFKSTDLANLRKAVCYAFADYICKLAGDFVDVDNNDYFTVFQSEVSNLAPGITQEIKYATSADGKQMVYYLATADLTRDDVSFYANYNNNDPAAGWAMQRVLDQANAAQNKYGNPDSPNYIPNYNVIASTNGAGFDMATGEPGGLLVMGGVEYHEINSNGFFGILKDGTPVIGTTEEYNTIYKGNVQEAIACFGATLVKDGEVCINRTENYYSSRAPRTAVGITKTGKVVLMVLDGRQEPFSCGGSMEEIAQIMREAGCVEAVNLDGGGSTTFVAKQEGAEELTVVNKPSDGLQRSVSTSLMMVSTAPSSTAFDRAVIDSDYAYMTNGATVQMTAKGVSATGNVAELPEGTTWMVNDASAATITEDGVLTALRGYGSVTVSLKLGEDILATKEIQMVTPDNVYFTKTNINAVYGQAVELPVKVLYGGKDVAFVPADLNFECSNGNAGVINGLTFTAVEGTGLKNVKIIAVLAENAEASASLTVALYKQGENSFDFDQAVGGNRQMAWDRQVSNSNTEDNVTYEVKNPEEAMVTSYAFAIDMTQIPIPEQLSELIYMLPGADMENASAWNFLLQLAERVSVLTEVKPVIRFDARFDVDYSELNLINECFELNGKEFDEETNTLTLTLNWIDQTQAIDPASANGLCMVTGIKLTPKEDADWGTKNSITAVNNGEISYKVYLRANALYSFAQKPENQKEFGLMPFVNPNLPSESGAYFGAVYNNFSDSYTLVNALKNGWINEDGGYAYYVDGQRLTGVQSVDGCYYDFGENGINAGQTKYTGLFFDASQNVYRYAKLGVLTAGWNLINGEWYYFSSSTMAAVSGNQRLSGVYFDFEEDGKLISGAWATTLTGTRYYYGPSYINKGWEEIDGAWYYFRDGYRVTGINNVPSPGDSSVREWHDFGTDGKDRGYAPDGIYVDDGVEQFVVNGLAQYGLNKSGDDYYFFGYSGMVRDKKTYAWATFCDLPLGNYEFGPDGKMLQGIVEKDGVLYYYKNGVTGTCGLIEYKGDYYYVYWGGVIKTGKQYVSVTYCDLPVGNYEFGADGKMLRGIVEKNGELVYYDNGITGTCGLIEYEGDYYYVYWGGKIQTGKHYVSVTYCDLPVGNYEFGPDGKMLRGIVEKDGELIFYDNGITGTCGLIEYEGDYYYVYWGGKIKTGKQYVSVTYCDLPVGNYEFGPDGKMLRGVVEKDGELIFYDNGITGTCGLIEHEGDYYYVYWGGKIKTGKQYVSVTYCDLPVGSYEFGPDGKMLQGIVEKDGTLYYYKNGITGSCGLIEHEGDYYYVYWGGVIQTGQHYVSVSYCDLPAGNYEFGADGKLLQGLVEKDGTLYYYENGRTGTYGLTKINDAYYFVYWGGVIKTGKQYISVSNCDLPVGHYEFANDGKILDGFVTKGNEIYYYVNGKPGPVGLNYIDGYYYFVKYDGMLIRNQNYYVWETNGLLLETTYTFNDLGQIVK